LHSFASTIQTTKKSGLLQPQEQSNKSTIKFMTDKLSMPKKLLKKLKENKKREKNSSDSRTQKRDATSMSKTSHLTQLMPNLKKSSKGLEISKASSFSPRKVIHFTLSYATRLQTALLLLDNNSTCLLSMENNYM
jgi:hypothetical protein